MEVLDCTDTSIIIMIQNDLPYETVIDFEWLYGKLKPGRYQIVKTVMDLTSCNKLRHRTTI